MKQQKNKIFISGNEAMGEAAIQAGCAFYAGYPITPQNELTAYMSRRMPQENRVFVQAESELAAVNMVLGAASTGARAMTSSSSPGISLKQEGISYLAACRLPSLIINVMRASPGLGSIGPSQSDYFQATKGGGHGDYRIIVLSPFSAQEAYDLVAEAFDMSDRYRIPSMILTDAVIGQMAEPVVIRSFPQSSISKEWALTGAKNRTGNIVRSLLLKEGALEEHNLYLQKVYKQIMRDEQRFRSYNTDNCEILLCSYGSIARFLLPLASKAKKIGLFRPVSLWPFPEKGLKEILKNNSSLKAILVVEASYGQMVEDVRLVVEGSKPVFFFGRAGGGMPQEGQVRDKIEEIRSGL